MLFPGSSVQNKDPLIRMQVPAYEFAANLPDGCPPEDATPCNGPVYLGIRRPPISDADLMTYAEKGIAVTADKICQSHGLSVWTSIDGVLHARTAFHFMKKWHIATAELVRQDGLIKNTPALGQSLHYTLWRDVSRVVATRFRIVMFPEKISEET